MLTKIAKQGGEGAKGSGDLPFKERPNHVAYIQDLLKGGDEAPVFCAKSRDACLELDGASSTFRRLATL
jgi:hypothetical protein